MDFNELFEGHSRNQTQGLSPILVFDPGHTTGWAHFHEGRLKDYGQANTKNMVNATENIGELFATFTPDIVVLEDYRIYKWRQKQHVGSELLTTRVIGCIETIAIQTAISRGWNHHIVKQPAHVAKQFCTDKKLKDWSYYQTGNKHANDAIRHGCYFLMFGAVRKEDKNQ